MNMPMIEIFVATIHGIEKQPNNQNLIYGQTHMVELEWMKENSQHRMFIMHFHKVKSSNGKTL